MASKPIYQFYVELNDYKPKMWRRFQVFNDVTMAKLGYIFMTMFEMEANHLFYFKVPYKENILREMHKDNIDFDYDRKKFSIWHIELLLDDDEYPCAENETFIEASDIKVKDVLFSPQDRMTFTYDYGDNWQFTVLLEEIIIDKELSGRELPRVIAGEGFGILEDCGGVDGLIEIRKALDKKEGPEYQRYSKWLGEKEFDLDTFDIDDINFRLKKVPRIYTDIYEFGLEPTRHSINILKRKYKKNTR